MTAPVSAPDSSSSQRNRTVRATSSAVVNVRRKGAAASFIWVSTAPGATQLTRTPSGLPSTARLSVRPTSANLLTVYAVKPGNFCVPRRPPS